MTSIKKITKTEQEWREQLSDASYNVTRKGGTERAFTCDNFPKDTATFHCICCNAPLFSGTDKFDSRTGWPSFTQPINDKIIGERPDNKLLSRRTEVICNQCDAHLGHVFPDGPQPTGLRYCINGVALKTDE